MELLPLFLERVEPLNGLDLESFGRINADEYTERIIRLLVSHVGEINEQDRSGYSILHERLKSYRNTYIDFLIVIKYSRQRKMNLISCWMYCWKETIWM